MMTQITRGLYKGYRGKILDVTGQGLFRVDIVLNRATGANQVEVPAEDCIFAW
jgi:hypothetical protein